LAANFRNVFYGLASGYVLKGVQFLVSLLMIPFLLGDRVLGIAGYGQVATLLALNGLLLIITDGVRVSQSRTIARSIDTESENGKTVGSCAQIIAMISLPVALITILYPEFVSGLAGLPRNADMNLSVRIIGTIYLVENLFSVFVASLHAVGRTYIVNAVNFGEVIIRSAFIFAIFTISESSVLIYFKIFLSVLIIKYLIFLFIANRSQPYLFVGISKARPKYGVPTLMYSFPVLANSLTPALLYKGSVVIVNKFLGSEAAAFLSILVVTIRNYITQVTYGSLHPMMVPLSARIDTVALSETASKFISESFRFYTIGVFGLCFVISAFSRDILTFWLGPDYAFLSLALQGFLFSSALDLSVSPIRSFLIAHGHASRLFRLTLPVGMACFAGMCASVALGAPWEIVIVFIMIFSFVSYGIIVDWVFASEFPSLSPGSSRLGWLYRPLAACILGFAAWGAGTIPGAMDNAVAGTAVGLIVIVASVVAVGHFLILDVRSAKKFGSTALVKIFR
jgi:O-antigen/teichoic acid export membrane protein